MSMPNLKPEYQIATVARLTGLNEQNIRTWERRYGIVAPQRTPTGRRLYKESDIELLLLLRQLVERGHAIGSLQDKSQQELQDLLRRDSEIPRETRPPAKLSGPLRALVIGAPLHAFLKKEADQFNLDIVEFSGSIESAAEEALLPAFELLLVDQPSLFAQDVEALSLFTERHKARFTVVVYRFSQREVLSTLETMDRIAALQGPVNAGELNLVIDSGLRSGLTSPPPATKTESNNGAIPNEPSVPERRFTDAQLHQLWNLSSEVKCECPQHLANLLISLTAFEDYSLQCQNQGSEDAKLHAYLHHTTALARAAFERAMERVIEAESIEI